MFNWDHSAFVRAIETSDFEQRLEQAEDVLRRNALAAIRPTGRDNSSEILLQICCSCSRPEIDGSTPGCQITLARTGLAGAGIRLQIVYTTGTR